MRIHWEYLTRIWAWFSKIFKLNLATPCNSVWRDAIPLARIATRCIIKLEIRNGERFQNKISWKYNKKFFNLLEMESTGKWRVKNNQKFEPGDSRNHAVITGLSVEEWPWRKLSIKCWWTNTTLELQEEAEYGHRGKGHIFHEIVQSSSWPGAGGRGTREMNKRINLQFIVYNLEAGKGQGTQKLSQRARCLVFIIPWSYSIGVYLDHFRSLGHDCAFIHTCNFLLCRLLILVIGMFPILLEHIILKAYRGSYTWKFSPHLYFLAPGQPRHGPLTQLLIVNNTGNNLVNTSSSIHSLLRALLIQHKHERKKLAFHFLNMCSKQFMSLGDDEYTSPK